MQQAVLLEGVDATVDFVDVPTTEDAMQLRFLGSPSVRVNGTDVEPAARDRVDYGLMCRVYRQGRELREAPSVAMIRASIRQALKGAPE